MYEFKYHILKLLNLCAAMEKKSLQGAAAAQEMTGAPVSMHPAAHANSPQDLIRIFLEAGGRREKTVVCHLEC